MNKYQKNKARARHTAQAWQQELSNGNYSIYECLRAIWYFEKIGKRYGLIKEFKENGII